MAYILFLTPQLPYPPLQGTSLRNWQILRSVAGSHDIALLSFAETMPAYVAPQLASLCRVIETVPAPKPRDLSERLGQVVGGHEPDMAHRLSSDSFEKALERMLRSDPPDIVQVEGLELARYLPLIRRFARRSRVVLDAHNAETQLQRRAYESDRRTPSRWPAAVYSRVQMGRLAGFEAWAAGEADAVIAVSDIDAGHIRDLMVSSASPVTVIPNTIDITEYALANQTVRPDQRFDLVFSGKMDYRPNVDGVLWFAESVWPHLRQRFPALTWAIVGQKPHRRLADLDGSEGITVTGRVEQVQPYLAGAKVNIIPLRMGSGTRLKLIEAMASSSAVVSTAVGAEGFPVQDGRDLLLADTPDEFVSAVSHLLTDQDFRLAIGQHARYLAEQYDWRRIAPRLDALYRALL